MSNDAYEVIIGVEVHVQLATRTKLFCGCSTQFGAAPNTQTCPVCIGMPGTLPVMNRRAYDLSLRTAVALNCEIPSLTKWDRKQYYYPDLPKGYQISQYDLPMSQHGYLEISDPQERFGRKKVRILRAHLEEDAGKSMHDEAAGVADSRIDLNRTGTPLLEIVSEPDMRSPLEARSFLNELKLLLTYIDVSDCNMQEGSLRVDANVNLHIQNEGQPIATPIVEIKNMNSFRAVERAVAFEAQRQFEVWRETGRKLGEVAKQTRGWDDQAGVTRPQRSKEESSDYRYFPDPDLVPVTTTAAQIDHVKSGLPELPSAIRDRLEADYEITPYDADVIVNQGRGVVDYFTDVAVRCGDGRQSSNWIQQDVLRTLNEQSISIDQFPISSENLGGLIRAVQTEELPSSRARDVFLRMLDEGQDHQSAMQSLGIEKVDDSALKSLCRELLAANPKIVADLQGGKHQAVGALIGQAKKHNPNVNPNRFRELCLQLINEM